jgi:hypothetical protein
VALEIILPPLVLVAHFHSIQLAVNTKSLTAFPLSIRTGYKGLNLFSA